MNRFPVVVRFGQDGLDTKTDSKAVQQGALLVAKNVVYKKDGTLSTRNGYDTLSGEALRYNSSNVTIGVGHALAQFDGQLLMLASGTLFTRAPRAMDAWVEAGFVPQTNVFTRAVIQNQYVQKNSSMCEHNGVRLTAYEDSRGGIRFKCENAETDAVIWADRELGDTTAVEPSVLRIGSFLFCVYRSGANLSFVRLNTTNPLSFDRSGYIVTDLRLTHPFWAIRTLGNNAVLSYQTDDPVDVPIAFFGYVTPNGDIGNVGSGCPAPQLVFMDMTRGGLALEVEQTRQERFAVAYYQDNPFVGDAALVTRMFSASLLQNITEHAVNTIDSGSAELSGALRNIAIGWQTTGSYRVAYTIKAEASASCDAYVKVGGLDRTVRVSETQSLDTVSLGKLLRKSVALVAGGFTYGSSSFFPVCHQSNLQPTNFIVRDDGAMYGKSLYGAAGGHLSASANVSGTMLQPVQRLSSASFVVPASIKSPLQAASGSVYSTTGIARTLWTFDDRVTSYANVQLGKETLFAGALPSTYDGAGVAEHGFLLWPESPTAPAVDSTGSGTAAFDAGKRYSWVALYRWTNNAGLIARSAPSTPWVIPVASASMASATLTVPTLRLTNKQDVAIELYRIRGNGTVYQKCASVSNVTSSDRVTIVDSMPDSTLVSNEFLYTTPGDPGAVLSALPPKPCSVITMHKNRFFVAGIEDEPDIVYFSQERVDGESVEWSDKLRIVCERYGGDITALVSLDDALVVFKETSILVTQGDGPGDNGLGESFLRPFRLPSDVGCVDARSIVSIPLGIVFKSSKGYQLLSRGLQVQYIGAAVEDFNDVECVSADVLEDQDEARFLLADGTVLAMSYYPTVRWSTFDRHSQPVDATVWDNRYVYLRADGNARVSSDTFLDNGAPILTEIVTSNIKVSPEAGMQQLSKVYEIRLIGTLVNPHTLSLEAASSYADGYEQLGTFVSSASLSTGSFGSDPLYGGSAVFGGDIDALEQFGTHYPGEMLEAIRFRIRYFGSGGEPLTLSEIRLDCGTHGKGMRMPLRKTIGS